MIRGRVEIHNLLDVTKRADAIFEKSQCFLRDKSFFWMFMGTTDEDYMGAMETSSGIIFEALKVRDCLEIVKLISADKHRIVSGSTEALIGEAHLLPDIDKIKRELTDMGINVRFFQE